MSRWDGYRRQQRVARKQDGTRPGEVSLKTFRTYGDPLHQTQAYWLNFGQSRGRPIAALPRVVAGTETGKSSSLVPVLPKIATPDSDGLLAPMPSTGGPLAAPDAGAAEDVGCRCGRTGRAAARFRAVTAISGSWVVSGGRPFDACAGTGCSSEGCAASWAATPRMPTIPSAAPARIFQERCSRRTSARTISPKDGVAE
jgi:hypothetical protein